MDIQKIKLGELAAFMASRQYRELDIKPISPRRALSYEKNPCGRPDDIVLYLITEHNRMIAFRSVLAGQVMDGGTCRRFAFCSGVWVSVVYRGRGLANRLLREAHDDWGGRLMFTNYSPGGLRVNMDSELFQSIHTYDGVRAYLAPSLARKYRRHAYVAAFKPFLWVTDRMIVITSKILSNRYKTMMPAGYSFEILPLPDGQCLAMADEQRQYQVFCRGSEELEWIFSWPWVTTEPEDHMAAYPFSSHSPEFKYQVVKVFRNSAFVGFFTFSVRERHLKSLHFYVSSHDFQAIADWIKQYCIRQKLEMATVYHAGVADYILAKKHPFLCIKRYGQSIFSTFRPELPSGRIIQDGEGDYVFT